MPGKARSRIWRIVAAGAAVITITAVAGCAPSETDVLPSSESSLDVYYTQDLAWGECEGTATNASDAELFSNPALECASVTVPLDYEAPSSNVAHVALLRLPARGQAEGSLLVDPGGPGGSGTSFVASTVKAWESNPVAERFDIVGFDPRGVGGSTPAADCYSDEEYDAGTVPRFGAVYEITSASAARDVARRCIEGSGGAANLTSVGSVNVVADMDIIREVLGDEKLSYLGYSYGSELGAMYTTTFPQNVRAVVLDGAVHPNLSARDFRLSSFTGLQARFDDLAQQCAQSTECILGPDPSAASTRLIEMLDPLTRAPLSTADGRELSIWDAYLGISAGLFSETKWPAIISALQELQTGSGEELMVLRDAFYGRTLDGAYGVDIDTNIAVRCMDWPHLSPEEQTQLAQDVGRQAPMFNVPAFTTATYYNECDAWPAHPTRDASWLQPATNSELPKTLVVSVLGDPATPHEGGVAMAEALGGDLLTVEGKQHGAYLVGGSFCGDEAVNSYLLNLTPIPAGAVCSL